MADRTITMGAATQIGTLEYLKFIEWYQAQYGVEPPANDVNLATNPQYVHWKKYIRPEVWSPTEETAYTKQIGEQFGFAPTGMPAPPTLPTAIGEEDEGLIEYGGKKYTREELLVMLPWLEFQERQKETERQTMMQGLDRANALQQAQLGASYAQDIARAAEINRLYYRPEGDISGYNKMQAAKAGEFETLRKNLISQFAESPRDWIKLYQAQNVANPFGEQRGLSPQENMAAAQAESEHYTKVAANIHKRMKDPNDPFTDAIIDNPKNEEERAASELLRAERYARDIYQNMETAWFKGTHPNAPIRQGSAPAGFIDEAEYATEARWAQERREISPGVYEIGRPGRTEKPKPKMPEIPQWLQVASGLTGRVPETRKPILTPSGQSWTQLQPGQQEMYQGLVNWSGERPFSDIMATMQKQLPAEPSFGRKFKPFAQRA